MFSLFWATTKRYLDNGNFLKQISLYCQFESRTEFRTTWLSPRNRRPLDGLRFNRILTTKERKTFRSVFYCVLFNCWMGIDEIPWVYLQDRVDQTKGLGKKFISSDSKPEQGLQIDGRQRISFTLHPGFFLLQGGIRDEHWSIITFFPFLMNVVMWFCSYWANRL